MDILLFSPFESTGKRLRMGNAIKKTGGDLARAAEMYWTAVEEQYNSHGSYNEEALVQLGFCCQDYTLRTLLNQTQLTWIIDAAHTGSPGACWVAVIGQASLSAALAVTPQQARAWLGVASGSGPNEARLLLAALQYYGVGGAVDVVAAQRTCATALDNLGNPSSVVLDNILRPVITHYGRTLGSFYAHEARPRNLYAAMQWYRRAAEWGCPVASYRLGVCAKVGLTGEVDAREAFAWFIFAADHKHAAALYEVGQAYFWGNGVSCALEQAIAAWKGAAGAGHAWGQLQYALCCEQGRTGIVDINEAMRWMARAAEQNLAAAYFHVGRYYREGVGGPVDLVRARLWEHKIIDLANEAETGATPLTTPNAIGEEWSASDLVNIPYPTPPSPVKMSLVIHN
jgi:TPR repeat protein